MAAGSGCEFSSLWAAGLRGAAARPSEQMCMSEGEGGQRREGRGVARGGKGILGGRWVGEGRPLPGHQGEQLEQRLCSVVRPYETAYGNALIPSCWVNRATGGKASMQAWQEALHRLLWPGMRHLTGLVSVRQPLFIVRLERSLHRDITAPRPWVEGALSRVFMDRPSTPQNTRASHTFLLIFVIYTLASESILSWTMLVQGRFCSCLEQNSNAVVLVVQRVSRVFMSRPCTAAWMRPVQETAPCRQSCLHLPPFREELRFNLIKHRFKCSPRHNLKGSMSFIRPVLFKEKKQLVPKDCG